MGVVDGRGGSGIRIYEHIKAIHKHIEASCETKKKTYSTMTADNGEYDGE